MNLWPRSVCRLLVRLLTVYYPIFALFSNILPFARTVEVSEQSREWLEGRASRDGVGSGIDRAALLETPGDALGARIAVLRSAQHTIDVVYHVFGSGDSTDALLGELVLAADRGVEVRILLDGKTGLIDREISGRMELLAAHPHITCRRYNPVSLLRPWEWQAMLHDKFIIVDGIWMILGGRNLGDRYFAPAGYEKAVTNDRDVLILRTGDRREGDGSVVHQLRAYMEQLWECSHNAATRARRTGPGLEAGLRGLRESTADFQARNGALYTLTAEDWGERTVPTEHIALIANPIHTGKKEPWVAFQMAGLALEAEQSVYLQTPYATANTDLLQALAKVAERVPETAILTNSLASSPNYPAFSNYYSRRERFAETGFSLWEYQSTDSVHGKSMVVDGRISAVGSLNLDDRSIYIDTESMLVIDSVEFARVLMDAMEDIRAQSLLVEEDGGGYAPGQALEPAHVSRAKRALMMAASVFSRLFQFLI